MNNEYVKELEVRVDELQSKATQYETILINYKEKINIVVFFYDDAFDRITQVDVHLTFSDHAGSLTIAEIKKSKKKKNHWILKRDGYPETEYNLQDCVQPKDYVSFLLETLGISNLPYTIKI